MPIHHNLESGFLAGTKVLTDKGLVAIEKIQVDDMVWSKPEDDSSEARFKPVVNTFSYEDKEIWLIEAERNIGEDTYDGKTMSYRERDKLPEFAYLAVTPNHPLYIVGMGYEGEYEFGTGIMGVNLYATPQWKPVSQIKLYEAMVSKEGIMYYITRIQPLYQLKAPEQSMPDPMIAWYQDVIDYYKNLRDAPGEFQEAAHEELDEMGLDDDDYDPNLFYDFSVGYSVSLEIAQRLGIEYGRKKGFSKYHNYDVVNELKDQHGNYIPYKATVYNLEVADNHTYFVDRASIWI